MISLDFVDCFDRRLRVGIRRQQNALAVREQLDGLFQKVHAAHTRHPLVYYQKRDRLAALLELGQGVQRRLSAIRAEDSVVVAVLTPQVAFNQPQNIGVIVHREYHWFCRHVCPRFHAAEPTALSACSCLYEH